MKKTIKLLTATLLFISCFFLSACMSILPGNSQEDIDAVNGVTTEGVIKATFAVYSQQYNPSLTPGVEPSKHTSLGSGVIYEAKDVGTTDAPEYEYKLLTNNHVTYHDKTKYSKIDYFVKDCFGEKITATLLCADANYDLAVITFKSKNLYPDLDFAIANPTVGTKVIAIGYPLQQINAVTLGKVSVYEYVSVNAKEEESNVKFKSLKHTAPIASGSSGGVVLTYDYKICGINFGAIEDDDGNFKSACAIPVYKVKEYLTQNNQISDEKLGMVA